MRTVFKFVVIAAVCFFAFGMTPRLLAQQSTETTFKLQGIVINSITGQPIARALVVIGTSRNDAMLTDSDGEFAFNNVSPGQININVTKPGYSPPGYNATNYSSYPKIYEVGPDLGRVVIKLAPYAVIYGQITGVDDEPIEGAIVEVLSARTFHKHQELKIEYRRGAAGLGGSSSSNGQSDDEGNFRFAGLPPGAYYIVVNTVNVSLRRRNAALRAPSKAKEAYPLFTYYPGVTDFESAMPVQVSGGQRLAVNFSLKQVPAFKVAGVIRRPQRWTKITSPNIADIIGQPLIGSDQFKPETGAFEFSSVPAGSYTVQIAGADENGRYQAAYRKMVVSGPITDARLALGNPVDIPIIVRKELSKPPLRGTCTSGDPGGEMHTSDCSDYPPVSIELISTEFQQSTVSSAFGPMRDPTDLTLKDVMPGKYMVQAAPQLGGYVASLRCGGTDLMRDELIVPDEGSVPPIEVTLRDDGATVKLRIRSDSPARSGWAVLVPDLFSRQAIVLDVKSGTDRDYSGLPPGDYKVFALDSRNDIDPSNPEDSLEKYSAKATSITLSANGSVTVSLDILRTGE